MSSLRPVAVVLTAPGPVAGTLDVPAALATLAGRIEFRACDGTGLAGALPGARALFMWDFFSSALADAWSAATDLEWIHLAAAGVDTLLFDALRDSDVVVTNARGTFDRPIAEFVLASVLAHAKRLYESWELQRNGVWRHRETATVVGARALVVGTGAIAREIARLLAAVGVVVRGAGRTPSVTDPDFTEVVSSLDLRAGVGWADYVINATPLTAQTTGLFDAAVFSAMRPGAMFVNVGRGQSVVEADLLAVLESGHLSGAALDVFCTEPLPDDSPLWHAPGMVVSAHLSGDVVGWKDALADQFVANAERWLVGEPLLNVVDKWAGYVRSGPVQADSGSPG